MQRVLWRDARPAGAEGSGGAPGSARRTTTPLPSTEPLHRAGPGAEQVPRYQWSAHAARIPQLTPVNGYELTIPGILQEGRNDVEVIALDTQGLSLFTTATLWAGSQTLNVTLVDDAGNPITDAVEVAVKLGDDQEVTQTASTSTGQWTFHNVPNRTILIEATDVQHRFGASARRGMPATFSWC